LVEEARKERLVPNTQELKEVEEIIRPGWGRKQEEKGFNPRRMSSVLGRIQQIARVARRAAVGSPQVETRERALEILAQIELFGACIRGDQNEANNILEGFYRNGRTGIRTTAQRLKVKGVLPSSYRINPEGDY